ncbi:sporulation protein YunB [Alteribacillus iranensis]|uniref:Sporulation protein YunB n=1 Tax=Alteribacillus iranensis TaxID=930128 RepID=A0A1I2ELQ8_9BACI|nr:sporulation protein YunB [Alteribacillus iranensis]SFE94024.1 sporulation protein YunB [Alteribacillus iranensis]
MRKRQFRAPAPRPLSFKKVLLISLLIFGLLTAQGIWLVNQQIAATLMHIATMETQKIATSAINHAVSKTVEDVDMNELIEIEKDEDGEIVSIGFDGTVYNRVVTNAVNEAQHYLMKMERGQVPEGSSGIVAHSTSGEEGALYSIPLGRATNNALLAQLGPLIPIQLTAIGDVDVELNESIKEKGINNTWVRVSLDLEVDVEVIIPFATKTDVVVTTVPVGMLFIPGKVPDIYSSSNNEGMNPAVIHDESDP